MSGLRNLRRRPLRSALTTAGVALGAAALVLLGALAEKLLRLVEGGRDFASGQITVAAAGTGGMMGLARGALLSGEQLRRLSEVPGVRLAAPLVMFPVMDNSSALPFTLAPPLTGPDSFVFMPFPTAQELLLESDQVLRGLAMEPGAHLLPLATAAAVFWNDSEDPEAVARRIRERLEHVSVLSPGDAAAQIDRALAVMNGL